jgi:DeoR/GlpR family transcriptional regulator of sugar metabolism
MTVRRDLAVLEAEGFLHRVRGGAIPRVSRSYEPPVEMRAAQGDAAKRRIARAAAALVSDGETAIIDVGTTTGALARALRGRGPLTVVTPSLPVALELAREPLIRVAVTGGILRPGELSLVGALAERAFDDVNCDVAFVGVAGLDTDRGLTEYNPEDARVKRAFLRSTQRTIVLADATKLGHIAFASVAPLSCVDVIVTDAPFEHPVLVAAAAAGIELVGADPDED